MHWQVTESGDGVEVDGVFDYDVNAFSPGGYRSVGRGGLTAGEPD